MNVKYSRQFIKILKRIKRSDAKLWEKIKSRLDETGAIMCKKDRAQASPHEAGLEVLSVSTAIYKSRVGKYRIFVSVEYNRNAIVVHDVVKRANVYGFHNQLFT